jgi:TM2 domain-containing membrane protein YozV
MRKSITALIILSIFYTSGNINSQHLTSLKLNDSKTDTVLHKSTQVKSPELAGFLSLIVPGVGIGQVYNGQTIKSVIHLGISGACVLVFMLGYFGNALARSESSGKESSGILLMIIPGSVFLINWVWSVADAVNSAKEINRLAAEKEIHSGILNRLRLGLSVDKDKSFNIKFTIGL